MRLKRGLVRGGVAAAVAVATFGAGAASAIIYADASSNHEGNSATEDGAQLARAKFDDPDAGGESRVRRAFFDDPDAGGESRVRLV
jgi:hypothetical protein